MKCIPRPLPLSRRGLFFLLLATGILTLGLLRRDLAALFWSGTFLLLILYSLIGNWWLQLICHRLGQRRPAAVDIALPARGVYPGEAWSYRIRATAPALPFPGLSCCLELRLPGFGGREILLRHNLTPGLNTIEKQGRIPYRGLYRSDTAAFLLQDILGLTTSRVAFSSPESLRVLPDVRPGTRLPFRSPGSEETDRSRRKHLNDQLLDVRKYYFGDDTRKINWKMLAHLDELYIRQGEESPPPDSRLVFVLDHTRSPVLPGPLASFYLDALVESACSLMLDQLRGETNLLLSMPGQTEPFRYTAGNKQDLLLKMADVWWEPEPRVCPLPGRKACTGIILSSPGSPALPGILQTFRERNWQANLFFKDFHFPGSGRRSAGLRSLLFLPPDQSPREALAPWEQPFRTALRAALDHYRTTDRSLVNVGLF